MNSKEINEEAFKEMHEYLIDHYGEGTFAVFCHGKFISCENDFGAAFDAGHLYDQEKPFLVKRV